MYMCEIANSKNKKRYYLDMIIAVSYNKYKIDEERSKV